MCKELYLMCKDMYVQGTIPYKCALYNAMCKAICKDMCKHMWNIMCKDMYVQGTIPSNVLCTMHCSGDYIDIGSELSSGSFIRVSDTGLEQEEGGRMVRELGSNSFLSFLFASSS